MRPEDEGRPLRWVLMLSFDRQELAVLAFGAAAEEELSRWPGSLYSVAAEQVRSADWARKRVSHGLECRLSPELARHRGSSLADLSAAFRAAAEVFSGRELAAILWVLLERAHPAAFELNQRLVRDAEVAAARALMNGGISESHLRAPRSPEADRFSAIG